MDLSEIVMWRKLAADRTKAKR
ncbi:hypothetical protein NKK50_11550 [Mesorhizobium sp. M0001]